MADSIIGDMAEKFGEDETAEYLRLAKAVRSVVHVWDQYVSAPVDSAEERAIARALSSMTNDMESHPKHTAALVEALCAIILHMRAGAPYEEWFTSLGIAPIPGAD